MEEIQWQAVRSDILDLVGINSTEWVRIKVLIDRAHQRGMTKADPLLPSAIEWAANAGLAEYRDGPGALGWVRLTPQGARLA